MERSRQMPQATRRNGKSLAHVLFLSAALSLLSALARRERRQLVLTARDRRKKVRVAPRRIAASLAFATLFSAGAGNGVVQMIDPASDSAPAADATTDTTTTTSTDPSADTEAAAGDLTPGDAQPAAEPPTSALADGPSGQASQPETPSAGETTPNTSPNTNVAGVRAAFRARVHSQLNKPGVAASAKSQPGAAKVVPARLLRPKVPPLVLPVKTAPLKKAIEREPEADEPNVAATVWLY